MRKIVLPALCLAAFASAAIAGTVSPANVVFEDGAVATPLTGTPGDPVKGKEWFVGRKLGNCLACHVNSDATDESFHGEVGPPLDGVADRWGEAELRGILANSKMTFEGTIMPAFYKDSGYTRPREEFAGKTILTAQQIEDVVAYLMTLNEN
ncbi:MAG: sulfur oxidation c-type cytochrome SoxX [Pseudomonadota bacterium]